MGLFSSDFEKALYQKLFDAPFAGYHEPKETTPSELAFDFCASLAHNQNIFPAGVGKKLREQAFYGSYALACQLESMFALDGESEQVAHAATSGFSKAAMKSGVPDALVAQRLGLIEKYINVVTDAVEMHGTDEASRENVFRASYLSIIGAAVSRQTLDGLGEEMDKFGEAFENFLESHEDAAAKQEKVTSILKQSFHENPPPGKQ